MFVAMVDHIFYEQTFIPARLQFYFSKSIYEMQDFLRLSFT